MVPWHPFLWSFTVFSTKIEGERKKNGKNERKKEKTQEKKKERKKERSKNEKWESQEKRYSMIVYERHQRTSHISTLWWARNLIIGLFDR